MSLRRSLRARAGREDPPVTESNMSTRSTRQSRSAASLPSVTVVRTRSESPEGTRRSIHLTVRMPTKKLREATSGNSRSVGGRRSHNVFTDNPIVTGPRTSRSKKRVVEVDTSEEEEEDIDDQEEDEVDDDDAPGEGEEEDDDDEDADADGDLDMDDAPPQPPVSRRQAKAAVAPTTRGKPAKSVEAKEMELDEEDDDEEEEELSEPDSAAEGEPDDQDEGETLNVGEGEELDEDDEEDDDLDSEDGTPIAGDTSKMTKRQRGNLGNDFLQLPMEPQIKKHLTAEERQMRRAEMARRRKNLSEKRNEEEKMDTINRLLRKQAPKRRGRIPAAEAAENAAEDQEQAAEHEPVDPTMVRWVSGREGSRVAVPEEWIGTPPGRIFGGTRKLVEEL